jgi:hypothetical protein
LYRSHALSGAGILLSRPARRYRRRVSLVSEDGDFIIGQTININGSTGYC